MIACRYCRRGGFQWVHTRTTGWRLQDRRGEIHACAEAEAYFAAKRSGLPAPPPPPEEPACGHQATPLEQAQVDHRASWRDDRAYLAREFNASVGLLESIPGVLRTAGPEFQFAD